MPLDSSSSHRPYSAENPLLDRERRLARRSWLHRLLLASFLLLGILALSSPLFVKAALEPLFKAEIGEVNRHIAARSVVNPVTHYDDATLTTTTYYSGYYGPSTATLWALPAAPGALYQDLIVENYSEKFQLHCGQHFHYIRATPRGNDSAGTPSLTLLASGGLQDGDHLCNSVRQDLSPEEQREILDRLNLAIRAAQQKRPRRWFVKEHQLAIFAHPQRGGSMPEEGAPTVLTYRNPFCDLSRDGIEQIMAKHNFVPRDINPKTLKAYDLSLRKAILYQRYSVSTLSPLLGAYRPVPWAAILPHGGYVDPNYREIIGTLGSDFLMGASVIVLCAYYCLIFPIMGAASVRRRRQHYSMEQLQLTALEQKDLARGFHTGVWRLWWYGLLLCAPMMAGAMLIYLNYGCTQQPVFCYLFANQPPPLFTHHPLSLGERFAFFLGWRHAFTLPAFAGKVLLQLKWPALGYLLFRLALCFRRDLPLKYACMVGLGLCTIFLLGAGHYLMCHLLHLLGVSKLGNYSATIGGPLHVYLSYSVGVSPIVLAALLSFRTKKIVIRRWLQR